MIDVELTVNGMKHAARVEPRRTLADYLREDLNLTGTHLGCEHGVCGACTVLVNGRSARSCLMLVGQADGCDVQTVESVADGDRMHAVQEAFRDSHSFQCGFCTPGIIMATIELLADNPAPSDGDIREGLSGNICRCTGYQSIVEGVLLAARRTA